jgi:uncharacterized protein YegL
MIMLQRILLIGLVTAVTCPSMLMAQGGVSSLSVGATRAGIRNVGPNGTYRMPSPELLRMEEFVNYHRHQLPLPAEGQRVRLDVRQMDVEDSKTVFQFGLTTPRAIDPEKMPPMNVVLVIDRSGSMSGDRIANVKTAIHAFIERFRKTDKVSIVGFNHNATLHLDATDKTKVDKIAKAIDSIEADGSTNLHAGLMLGYQQALKHFDPERTNRVIFLTDGNANVGVTESEEIARQSRLCNQEGISLTTIGLGVDFNYGLLRQLADAGLGTIHFFGDSKDIKKIFVSEVDSLLAPAARKVRLMIDFGNSSAKPKIYGYEPVQIGTKFVFKLDDLNHGATQVILVRLPKGKLDPKACATLEYIDALTGEKIKLSHALNDATADEDSRVSVNRNYAIALVAKSIHAASEASNAGDCQKAADRLNKGIKKAQQRTDHCHDEHVDRVLKIARAYHKNILECIASSRGD